MGRRGARRRPFLGRVDELARHPAIVAAALIADEFGLDPIMVLDERSRFRTAVRAAAYVAVQTSKAEAAARAR